jgi:hypothetical protein
VIVLGAFPEYLEEAIRREADALAVSARVWRFLEKNGEQWTTCRSYLNASRHVNQEILLATNPAAISSGSMLAQELAYLLQHGFRLDFTGTKILRMKQG